jgi:DeoR/GlpR family transcriptional regulator of sugar metabolism
MSTLADFHEPQREYRQYVESADDAIDESREAVLSALVTEARGYDARMSAKDLAARTTVSASTVRDIVAELRTEFGVPVASLGGYFVIESDEELERVLNAKRQEIETRKRRMREITAAYNRHEVGE